MDITPLHIFVCILVITIVVSIIVYYIMKAQYKRKIKHASWETLKRNHPDLEKLFCKYAFDSNFFEHVDQLMIVDNIDDFNTLVSEFTTLYPDFNDHMKSLQMSNSETWRRFCNRRALAKVVFDSIRP